MEQREKFGSRLGFILISAGCAIGIGNVWKFPYLCGQSGGGAFVLLYLFFLAILGMPAMTMEFAMGRAAQKSPVKMYQELEPKGSKWHLHGIVCLIGNFMLMMYYTTVAGWMIQYFVLMVTNRFEGLDAEGVAGVFGEGLGNPLVQVGCMLIVICLGFFINSKGLQAGLERVIKVMMIALLGIMVVLAVNSVFLKGADVGLKFYLQPNFENMKEIGILKVVTNAMNQAFFTLSLGVGAIAIFGSYINKDSALLGESVSVIILDTFVAVCSGLIIFPACFAYGVQPDSGPSLIFITLPNIFNNMAMGRLWGSLFFVFMTFAAFSTVLAVFENIMAMTMDLFGWDRKKAGFCDAIAMIVASLPCALGYNILSWIQPLGAGSTVLDFEDYIVSQYLLPLGALIFVLFCTRRYGWGWKNFVQEANTGKGLKIGNWMRFYCAYILPVIILIIFILGII